MAQPLWDGLETLREIFRDDVWSQKIIAGLIARAIFGSTGALIPLYDALCEPLSFLKTRA
jgi:hypothetical protein